jgi:hypothetical protein
VEKTLDPLGLEALVKIADGHGSWCMLLSSQQQHFHQHSDGCKDAGWQCCLFQVQKNNIFKSIALHPMSWVTHSVHEREGGSRI